MNNIYNESDEFATLILMAFFVIGVFIKFMIGTVVNVYIKNDTYVGKADITIFSNMIIIMSILCIASLKKESDPIIIYPIVMYIIALLWETSYTSKYSNRINRSQVPDTYYVWGNWSSLLLLSTTVIIILYFTDKKKDMYNTVNMLYIIIFFNYFVLYIQQSILDNFMVDKKIEY
jgi:hypothetical protein